MRISDWSSDVCSSDLRALPPTGRLTSDVLDTRELQRSEDLRCAGGAVAPPERHRVVAARERRDVPRYDEAGAAGIAESRSEERRVGERWGRTWRSRVSP